MRIPQGDSRDHRPDRNQGRLELIVERQAGMPVLMKPLRGKTHDSVEFGRVVTAHGPPRRTVHHGTDLVADSALDTAENLGHLAQSGVKWRTRVPATLREVQAVLAHVNPATMAPLADG